LPFSGSVNRIMAGRAPSAAWISVMDICDFCDFFDYDECDE
jgi:hypothetical protein